MDRVFEKAFTAIIRSNVLENNAVTIDGLGTFKLEHIKQKASKSATGTTVMSPPRDIIVFKEQGDKK